MDTNNTETSVVTAAEEVEDKYPNLDPDKYNLPGEELFPSIKKHMLLLHSQTEWNSAETLPALKYISSLYTKKRSHRPKIVSLLIDLDFPELAVKLLTFFDNVGVFSSDATWFPTYYTYNICWNYTDASVDLGKGLAAAGIVKIIAANISHQPYLDNQESKNVTYILKSSLSIIQNLCLVPNIDEYFDEFKMKELLQPYLTSTNEMFKVLATMALTALINEEENKMMEDTGAIKFIVQGVIKALKNSKTRRYRGFSTSEMTHCLSRLAVNDSNKVKIISEGGLTPLVDMLKSDIEEEQQSAARTIWNISFDKTLVPQIREQDGLLAALQERSQSDNKLVAKFSSGALWVLDDKAEARGKEAQAEENFKDHIFISYSWADQKGAIVIKDHLKANGYRVWFDLEQMGGSTLEAMAAGVENAAVVLVCVSEKYKYSPNCRTEAEYTFQLKKPIVPVMMQRRYKPDGWLGMLLGSKFYVNFDGKYEFATAFDMLVKELKGRGKESASSQDGDVVDAIIKKDVAAPVMALPMAEPVVSSTPSKELLCKDWTTEQIQEWRNSNGLTADRYEEILGGLEGRHLAQLAIMKDKAPEFFFSYISVQRGLQLPEMLTLCDALSHC